MYVPIVIHKEIDSDYGVTVPDLPGCYSAGESVDDALRNIKEAIQFHIEMLLEDKIPFNFNFRNIEELSKIEDLSDGIFALVNIDLDVLTAEKTRFNVSWPKYILNILDEKLKHTNETRSGYLAKLALEDVKKK